VTISQNLDQFIQIQSKNQTNHSTNVSDIQGIPAFT
jgi:hypothetical protein